MDIYSLLPILDRFKGWYMYRCKKIENLDLSVIMHDFSHIIYLDIIQRKVNLNQKLMINI